MARLGPDGHVRFASGIPSASDILTPISALHPISSGSPPTPDVGGTPGERLSLTRLGHHAPIAQKAVTSIIN